MPIVAPNPEGDKGIRCPKCGCAHHATIRTRPAARGRVMRVRKCLNCTRQIVTYEVPAGEVDDMPSLHDLSPDQREGWITRLMEIVGFRI